MSLSCVHTPKGQHITSAVSVFSCICRKQPRVEIVPSKEGSEQKHANDNGQVEEPGLGSPSGQV